jgi:putative transposase
MDFVHDYLADGRRLRTLNIVDAFTRECLAIEVDTSLPSARVVRVLDRLVWELGLPESLRVDNGPEFISMTLDRWAFQHGVLLDFTRPGKPTENGFVESFQGRFRDECLNAEIFHDLEDAKRKIHAWRDDYNRRRPHSALGNLSPREYLRRWYSEARSKKPIL